MPTRLPYHMESRYLLYKYFHVILNPNTVGFVEDPKYFKLDKISLSKNCSIDSK